MSTPAAWYKWVRLGDVIQGPGTTTATAEGAGFERTVFGDRATAIEQGAGATSRVKVDVALVRGSAEAVRAFDKRKIQLGADLTTAAGDANSASYRSRGDFVYVWDVDTDTAVLNGAVTAGSAASIVLTTDPGVSVGSYLFWTDGADYWEVAEVDAWDGGTLTATATTSNNWDDGENVYLVHWYLPNCWRTSDVSIAGGSSSNLNATFGIELDFEGPDAIVKQ